MTPEKSRIALLELAVKRLRETLSFYGQDVMVTHDNEVHWHANDDGKRARETLIEVEKILKEKE